MEGFGIIISKLNKVDEINSVLRGEKMNITEFWNSNNDQQWKGKLNNYWSFVKPENFKLEKKMDCLDSNKIQVMSANEFYRFLNEEYYVWKYTAKNRSATTRKSLQKYMIQDEMNELEAIHQKIFSFDLNDAAKGLSIALKIRGLGTAGASGLLALLYPEYFGTVDQHVVKALNRVENLSQKNDVMRINPDGIKLEEAALLIQIMREKAKALNSVNNTSFWTPRKIDMVLLWADR